MLIYVLVEWLIGLDKLTLKFILKTKLLKLTKTFTKKRWEGKKRRKDLPYKT